MAGFKPRVISLTKRQGQTFGFYLRVEHGEDGHLIRCLEMGGPAELAGMKDGDRLLRVNGTFVDDLSHSKVVDIIKESGVSVVFHILDEASYKQAKEQSVDLFDPSPATPVGNNVSNDVSKPKLCYLVKSSKGFGFSLRSVRGEQGLFMTDVVPGGVADKAGVKVNDRLLEINGESMDGNTHDQVVEKIKSAGSTLMFLLVDEEADRYYRSKQIKIGVWLATTKFLPLKPRVADVTKGPDGYGFFLRKEPNKTGHFIKDIDRGSPAERAGLMDKDKVVAVDGTEVDTCTHEQVVERIKQSGSKCCLLVVDKEVEQMYEKGGVSPMIFWEEMRGSASPPSYKEAMTLPTPVRAPTPVQEESEEPLRPRLCRLEKTPSGFGFHLNGIQGLCGQSIRQVEIGGAADKAGLMNNDIVVEVNGVNVEKSTHGEVVRLICDSGNTLVMLVAQKSIYDQLAAKGVAITAQMLGLTSTAEVHNTERGGRAKEEEEEEERAERAEEKGEEREERAEKEKEERDEARAETPPAQTRERTLSVSSSTSNQSFDDRL